MDPASLSLGVISVSETAFTLSKFLTDTYSSYRNAPEEVLEIAHEVNLCRCLMVPFGERSKNGSSNYTTEFEQGVQYLIENSNKIFKSIKKLIPDDGKLEKGSLRRWRYILDKSQINSHRKRLKQIQQMFMFMKEAMGEAIRSNPGGATVSNGTAREVPITLTGAGTDHLGAPVMYTATLVMQPAASRPEKIDDEVSYLPQLKREKGKSENKKRNLRALRQSPYFSSNLVQESAEPAFTRTHDIENVRVRSRKNSVEEGIELPSELEAADDVDRFINKWFGSGTEEKESHRPSIVVPDPARPTSSSPQKSPDKSPSPRTPSVTSGTQSPQSPLSKTYFPSEAKSSSVKCDSCKQETTSTRYKCRSCDDFNLCKKCYDNPQITIRLRHRHPTTHFVEQR